MWMPFWRCFDENTFIRSNVNLNFGKSGSRMSVESNAESEDQGSSKRITPEAMAFAYLYPDLFFDAHPQPATHSDEVCLYCAFCGHFLSESRDVSLKCVNPRCGVITSSSTEAEDVLNEMLGPPPIRQSAHIGP
jgi:hypothetical protein